MQTDSAIAREFLPAYAGNYTKNRAAYGGKISEITVHHCAGQIGTEQLGALWQTRGRRGSSHYGVCGAACAQYVAESDIAWTNSDWAANCRAVTVEVSNSGGAPDWRVSDASLETLTELVADIARRNGLHPLVLGKSLTWHSMYAATACPGPYLYSRLGAVCTRANAINAAREKQEAALSEKPVILCVGPASAGDAASLRKLAQSLGLPCSEDASHRLHIGPASAGDQRAVLTMAGSLGLAAAAEGPLAAALTGAGAAPGQAAAQAAGGGKRYAVQAGAFAKRAKADAYAQQLAKKGIDAIVKARDELHIVQCGVFASRQNAESCASACRAKGVQAAVKEVGP